MVLVALIIGKVAVFVWALNKGFDIGLGDEGLTMLMYAHPHEYKELPSQFNHIVYGILPIHPLSAYGSRIVHFLAEVLELLMLGYASLRLLKTIVGEGFATRWHYLALWMLGFFGIYLSIYSRTFSYNDTSFFFLITTTSMLFLLLVHYPIHNLFGYLYLALRLLAVGFLLAVAFFVKGPSALVLGILILFGLWYVLHFRPVSILQSTLFLGLGFLLFMGVYFHSVAAFQDWLQHFRAILKVETAFGYNYYYVLMGYLQVDVIGNAFYFVVPGILSGLSLWYFKRKGGAGFVLSDKQAALAYGIGLALLIVFFNVLEASYVFPPEFRYAYLRWNALVIYSVIYCWQWLYFTQRDLFSNRSFILLLLVLTLLPLIGAAGSNNPLIESTNPYFLPHYLLIFLTAILAYGHYRYRWLPVALAATGVVYGTVFFVWMYVYHPQGMLQPLAAQTEHVQGIPDFQFDHQTALFLDSLQGRLHRAGFKQDDPLLAVNDLPSVTYLCGGMSPKFPWYFPPSKGLPGGNAIINDYFILQYHEGDYAQKPFILSFKTDSATLVSLKNSAYNFPDAYIKTDSVNYPFEEGVIYIYRPK